MITPEKNITSKRMNVFNSTVAKRGISSIQKQFEKTADKNDQLQKSGGKQL
jgi:hypothetical protein